MFCTYCRFCVRNGKCLCTKKDDVFVNSGFDNWKKVHEKFLQHSRSELHKESLMKVELMKQESIVALLNKQTLAAQKQHQDQLITSEQLTSLLFLLRQGLAIGGHDDKFVIHDPGGVNTATKN